MFDISTEGISIVGSKNNKLIINSTQAQLWWILALVKHSLNVDLVMVDNDRNAEFHKLDYCKDGTQTAILIKVLIEEQRILKRRHDESKTT